MRNTISNAIPSQIRHQLYASTVRRGQVCRCIVPKMPGHPEALWSDQGQVRPVIITEVDDQLGTVTLIPGTSTDNRWGCSVSGGQYSLDNDTYFHSHEPRTVAISALQRVDEQIYLSAADFARITSWKPPQMPG